MTDNKDKTPKEQQAAAKKKIDKANARRTERRGRKAAANVKKGLTAKGHPRSPRLP